MLKYLTGAFIFVAFYGSISDRGEDYEIPVVKYPIDNPNSKKSVELGKLMFFDKRMSRDSSLSCGSCHNASKAFTDAVARSIGKNGEFLDRNAPSLINIGFQESGLMWDKGVPTLEMQVLVPVQEHKEFDFNLMLIAERFKKDSQYVRLALEGYNRKIDPFVITRAIANYERNLVGFKSKYDRVQLGFETLNKKEQLGFRLFKGKANCIGCHGGIMFSDFSLKNNGLYNEPYPLDSGRMRITHLEKDRDLFKVPSLRNVALTAPYMHNGSISTLDSVIHHYEKGGKVHSNKSGLIKPFQLTEEERENLVLFLKTLTDL
jgi:cytochrome c peroxidase